MLLYHAISLAAESPLLRYPTCTFKKKTKYSITVAGPRLNTWKTVNDDDDDSSALANTRP